MTLVFMYIYMYIKSVVLCVLENIINQDIFNKLKICEQIAFERFLL